MQVKDLPVVMLAAGMSKRFNPEHRTTHKSLLRIDGETRIIDLILNGLIKNAISQVIIILGYKSKEFSQYLLAKKNLAIVKNLHLHSIFAGKDYVKGPAYTLLSLISELEENIGDFVVIPSDTIFHPSILDQIFSCEADESQNQCFVFSLQLSDSTITKINQNISFNPQLIERSSVLYSTTEENNPHIKEYFIPILIFIPFVSKIHE